MSKYLLFLAEVGGWSEKGKNTLTYYKDGPLKKIMQDQNLAWPIISI